MSYPTILSTFRLAITLIALAPLLATSLAQTNLLADPGLEASEPATTENPSWTLVVDQPDPNGRAAQFQSAGWASNPNGAPGIGLWLRAFLGSSEDAASGAQATLTQRVPATPGLNYELTAWHKVEANYISASTLLAMDFIDDSDTVLASQALELNGLHPADGSWVAFQVKAVAPDLTAEVQVRAQMIDGVNANANPQSAMFDDFFLRTIDQQTTAFVADTERTANGFRVQVENVEGSTVDPSTAILTIDGVPSPVEASQAGDLTTFTHIPSEQWGPGARLDWVFLAMDTQGNAIEGNGLLRVPGSLVYGGGLVRTVQVLAGVTTNSVETARQALAAIDEGESITVETPFVHFEDGDGPPILQALSRPYPLFDPSLGGDEMLVNSDNFVILSTGEFFLKEAGTIPFVVNSDDGFEFHIDGEFVGSFGNRGRGDSFLTAELDAGRHAFELLQWEASGAAGVSLFIGRLDLLEGELPPPMSEDAYELLSGYDVHQVVTEDSDGDGMDDFKETFFFASLNRDGNGDFDSDGLKDVDELRARADPTEKDTDGDGLEDGAEVNEHGSSPALTDTDGDQLDDAREVNELNTNPALADTDEDGFDDQIELALATDPLDQADFPNDIVAVDAGSWNAASTWMDGQTPHAGETYMGLGDVIPFIESAAGSFAGDSLALRGPHLEVRLNHAGTANANLSMQTLEVALINSNRLEGALHLASDVIVNVAANITFDLASQLNGEGNLRFFGDDPDEITSAVILSGAGSDFTGSIHFEHVDARGTTPGSLGTGTITIANGSLTFGYPLSSPTTTLQLQGTTFEIVLDDDVAVGNLVGLTEDGEIAFSLLDLPGVESGPFTADDLLALFEIDEGIRGSGTLTLLRDTGDLDNDGLRDSWEVDFFGDTSPTAQDDPDADGLSNLAEQTAATDPNDPDTDKDTLTDGDEVSLHRSDPTSKDSDSDGLEDADEVARELNPSNPDTDGDGLQDGFEVVDSMTDPSNEDTDGDGFPDGSELDTGSDPNDATNQPNRFVVRTIASEEGPVANLANAQSLRDGTASGIETVSLHASLNFSDNLEVPGLFPGDLLFPGEVTDHFIVHATGKFVLPEGGLWGLGFHSDDGGQLIIDGTEIIEFDGTRGRNSTMRTLNLTEGEHTLEILMFERIGGAALEVFRSRETGDWGDIGNGSLPEEFDPVLIQFERQDSPPIFTGSILSVSRNDAGTQLALSVEGLVSIEYSTDLQTWENIAASVSETFVDSDPARQSRTSGFYRLRNVSANP